MQTARQRGVALITALLVVAIAGVLAVELVWQTNLDLQRTEGLMSMDQAKQMGYGAEDAAAALIQQAFDETNSQKYEAPYESRFCGDDGSGEGGGGFTFPLDLSEKVTAQGTVTVYGCDLEGRFNLNNLVNSATGKKDPVVVAQFKRLLRVVVGANKLENIDVNVIADSAVDWIDPDSNEELDGAEDAYYTNLPVPYQAANGWFSSASELLAIKGMTRELYAALRFYVTALPVSTSPTGNAQHTKINVNTARAPVLRSLGDNITDDNAARWISQRQSTSLDPATDFTGLVDAGMLPYLEAKTDYFGLQSIITIGTTHLQMYSLLERVGTAGANGGFRVRQRCFDCVENEIWPNPPVISEKDTDVGTGSKATMGDKAKMGK